MSRSAAQVAVRAKRLRFERSVQRALAGIPIEIRAGFDNVDIVIEDEPRNDPDGQAGDELFGLYEGTPLTERGGGSSFSLPDKITIFRGPLERAFDNPNELESEIRKTVLHEFGHHVGFDEEGLDALGLA